ncbi:hypothetical protein GGR51DRAFT_572770 [Nemania sp. FL0031]|nr:hypothetical protein GGR51DRAFT_572770 [Nemania sp. FL0031]
MEPLSALALSGNVLQFIESAVKLISEARQVCHSASGITTSNRDAITVYEDFRDAAGSLLGNSIQSTTADDLAVASLADRCQELSEDLVKDLKNLQAKNPGSKREGLRIAWRALREKGELESMEKRLDRYRQQILTRIIFMMSREQSSTFLLLKECAQMDEEAAKKSREQLETLRKELLTIAQTLEQRNQAIFDKFQEQEDATAKLSELISNISSTKTKIEKEDWILGKLKFPGMRRRENAIGPALAGTYRWLLYPPKADDMQGTDQTHDGDPLDENDIRAALWGLNRAAVRSVGSFREGKESSELKKETRMRFLSWLESGSGIFYLSGKPGSGKSTMMKFITREKRTAEALGTWAAGKQLVFSSFFFWSSGLTMQRSIEGLYRSLLWQTLKECPELIPVIFPRLWSQSPERFIASISDTEFSIRELEEVFLKLTNTICSLPGHCVCFFIDGLDEFEGDYWKLAKILKKWASSPGVKICVSSRPYSDFENSFATEPEACLRLHAHTRQDMLEAAKSELESDERLSRFQLGRHDYLPLAKSAVEKSNGVFLWLRLALRHLLRGIGSQYSITQLEEILQSMPNDVSDMFQNMLDKVLARPDRVRVAITLLCLSRPALKETWHRHVLYFSVLDDVLDGTITVDELIRRTPKERYSPSQITQRIHTTESRLRGRCEDFVDILNRSSSKKPLPIHRYVEFVHRDLRDFLVKDSVVEKLYRIAGWDPPKHAGLHRYVGVVLLRMVPSLASSPGVVESIIDDFHDSETTSTEELELLLSAITLNAMTETQEVTNTWRQCAVLALRDHLYSPYVERKVMFNSSGPAHISSIGMRFITTAAFYRHNEFVLRLTTKHPFILEFNVGSNLLLSASLGGASVRVVYSRAGERFTLLPQTGGIKRLVAYDTTINHGGIGALLYPQSPVDVFSNSEGDPGYQMDDFGQSEGGNGRKLRKGTTEPLTLARALLEQGASPNLMLRLGIPAWNELHWTPWTATLLSIAGIIRRGEMLDVLPEILELYLSHGADPTVCFVGRYLPRHRLEPMPVWRVGPGIYAHLPLDVHIQKLFNNDDWYYLTLAQVVELLEHPEKNAVANLLQAKSAMGTGNPTSKPLKIVNLELSELGNCYFFVSMIASRSSPATLAPDASPQLPHTTHSPFFLEIFTVSANIMMDAFANSVVATHDAIVSQGETRTQTRRRQRSGIFTCQECGRTLSRSDALVRHARTAHGSGQDFWCHEEPCRQAKKGFRRFHDYRNHMRRVHNKIVSPTDLDSAQSDGGSETSAPASELQTLPQHNDEPELQIDAESEVEYEIKRDAREIAQHLPYPQIQPESRFVTQYSPQYNAPNIPGQALQYVPDLNNDYSGGSAFRVGDNSQYTQKTPWQASLYVPDLNGSYGGGPAFRKEDGIWTGHHQAIVGPSPNFGQSATSPNQYASPQGGVNMRRISQLQNTLSSFSNPHLLRSIIQQRQYQIHHQQNIPSSPFMAPTV